MPETIWPFITHNDAGVALIEGTRTKVIEVALDHVAYGWNADQIHRQYGYLSLPQIHSALGYYYDHQEECDRQIEASRLRAAELRRELESPSLVEKIRSRLEGA